jgi:citrate synthase
MKYMVNEIKRKENVVPWVKNKLENKEKIMGFGHRVYQAWDPRAVILRELSLGFFKKALNGELIDKIPNNGHDIHDEVDYIIEMTEILNDYIIKTKNIYPNVDLYSAGLLHTLGIPTASFTPLFAASRSAGWVAHALEQLKDNKLIRPRLCYIGQLGKKYMKIENRT